MPARSRRFYVLSIAIYLAGVIVLAALALFGRGSTERIAEASLRVHYRVLPLFGRSASWATLSWQGLRLSFDRAHPLASGEAAAPLASARVLTDGADLVFEDGRWLEVRRDSDGAWSLRLAGAGGAASIQIPWRLRGSFESEEAALSWQRGGQGFLLTVPSGSRIDADARLLEVAFAGASAAHEVRLVATGAVGGELASRWLSDSASLVDDAGWTEAVRAFRAAAWRGWTRDRLGPDGTLPYTDNLGASLLAEALARGSYLAQRAIVADALARRLRDEPDGAWTLAASPYIGRLAEYARRLSAREAASGERIRRLLAAKDPQLLMIRGLVPFALDHAASDLARSLAAYAGSIRLADLTPAEASGALETLLDYAEYAGAIEGWEIRCREIVQRKLLPAIVRADAGLFIAEAPGRVDVASSIAAGALLQRTAEPLGDARLSAVGRTLVASAVALARVDGTLPATLQLSGGAVASPEGDLDPEMVYAQVGGDRFVAREIPLHRSIGPGAWVWTAARVVSVDVTGEMVRLRITYPAGNPHYLLVAGLRPFLGMELHGIAWRPDPGYAQYSDGWTYDEAEQLLYLKLTGRQDEEQIVVRF